jgi:hypothetical protein
MAEPKLKPSQYPTENEGQLMEMGGIVYTAVPGIERERLRSSL